MVETKDKRCEACKGHGRVIDQAWYEETCRECKGFGVVQEKINVPQTLNDLYPDVKQNLEILAEECAEVIQIKSKITRFGIDDCHPKRSNIPNRHLLEEELGHILGMVEILISNGIVSRDNINAAIEAKILKIDKWYNRGQYVTD